MPKRAGIIAALFLVAAGPAGAQLPAPIPGLTNLPPAPPVKAGRNDVVVIPDPCRKRMTSACRSARQISRYGVETYWEVLYVVQNGKWLLTLNQPYGVELEETCGREGYKYLRSITPVLAYRVPNVLSAAQDVKEECLLNRIRADGLAMVNQQLNVQATSFDDFHVLRIAKADLASGPPQAREMLAPWIEPTATP